MRHHPHKLRLGKLCLTYYDLWNKQWCFELSWNSRVLFG